MVTVTFSRKNYEKLSQNEVIKFGAMAADLQNETSDAIEVFQLYFYKNLFHPLKKGKTINDKKLTKNTILTLLNKIFSTSDKENKQVIEQFAKEYEIRRE